MRILTLASCAVLVLLGAGCSAPSKPKEAAKAPEPVTGLHALAQMYNSARKWAPDVLVFRVNSMNVDAVKQQPGRAGAWQAVFVSPTLGQSRGYTFSVADVSTTMRAGIFADTAAPFSARSQSAQPFSIAAAKKDTDEVYEVARKKAASYAGKNPNMTITYVLELTNRFPSAAWRVIWGESVSNSSMSVLVDASTGEPVGTLN
jgi:hypothetical protein